MEPRIGTSGWVYRHWRGVFYPPDLPQGAWFARYAREFDTVEINNSFYRLPSDDAFDAWRAQAPPGFLYAVKASRFLTHLKKLKDPEEPLARFFARAGRLGPALGPVLYQLPPRWGLDLPRLAHFLAALPPGYEHAVEFRDASWLREEAFALLERHGVAHCLHDLRLPALEVPPRVTAPLVYVRLHGGPDHGGDYSQAALAAWAARIAAWRDRGLRVVIYFNNDVGGHALANARTLRTLLATG